MLSDRRTFLAGAAALGLAACAGKSGRTKLVLGDQVHLLESKAEAAGALNDLPYDVQWVNFVGAAPLLEALNAGAVDTAPAGDLPVVLAASAGVPLKIIAGAISSTKDIGILVPGDSRIRSVAGLAGKRVIVSSARGSISHYLLLEALKEAKLDRRKVDIGFMLPNDAAAAFAAGQIEAWATFGTYQLAAEQRGARVLRNGEGINSGLTLIAASQAALDNPAKREALRDVLARLRKASLWSQAHPADYARIFVRQTKVDPKLAALIVERQNPLLIPPDATVVKPLQRVVDRFHADGELPAHIDVASIVDAGLFPA
ncbi:ABC transporter substrate-binding protein [Sphingobium fuliginis]|uniref:ABC-type nitrate/sulfonate/bicarbonate transport system, periplasmic component n=1 Tax=Sphingobium fuliginis (strain ATCC 27551) TaxID=336203 RepID=A0A292ZLK4_SPHSA|nr:ABC transporter substrate-binding protein [Sphingobium fuliginis]GAY23753.1 ABC-type nitrate/sulfonate/bicarbonate transport system, periplasmic component [Sphingobium fuliginis]